VERKKKPNEIVQDNVLSQSAEMHQQMFACLEQRFSQPNRQSINSQINAFAKVITANAKSSVSVSRQCVSMSNHHSLTL
jgi:hypothetical protein